MDLQYASTIIFISLGILLVLTTIMLFIVIKIKSATRIKEIENYGKPSEKRLKELLEHEYSPNAVFSGIYVPYINKGVDRYAEIDAVVVLSSGVFVIELKSHNGKITNGDTKYWTQVYNDKRISFYNPMYQNDTHVKVINSILKSEGQYNVPIYSVVVFTSNKVTFTNDYKNLVSLDELTRYIKKTGKSDAISIPQTTRIRTILRSYIRTGKKIETDHKKAIRKNKYRDRNKYGSHRHKDGYGK